MLELFRRIAAIPGTIGFAKKRHLQARKNQLADFMSSGQIKAFPAVRKPRCTIVIPTYNGAEHTLQCLLSLLPIGADWLEILVYDDCGQDQTMDLLKRFQNIVVHRAEKNQGFLRTVNAAAKLARGEFIIPMNNDAKFVKGSIPAALDLMENDISIGYMGARVKFASGALQEAGCIIYQNGTTNGYLRFASQDDPRALVMRDVDYCSGVFCILRRERFLQMGGFDLAYAPAYYEESDFCMRLRELGLRTVYNPDILIEHFEFGSQPTKSARKNIAARRKIFLDRWQSTLIAQGHAKSIFSGRSERAAYRLQNRK